MIVLDTSSVLPWFFPDEFNELCDYLQRSVVEHGAFVPALWYFEIANGLLIATRRDRIIKSDAEHALTTLSRFPIHSDNRPLHEIWSRLLLVAGRHGLSVYDASYLELAMRKDLPLATLDRKLAAAASTEGTPVFGQTG